LELREQWLRGALETATNCDAIFLDPDNGLEKDTTDDVKQSSWFGVFVGTQVNLCKNMSLNVEYQHTAFANAVGANVVWRY
jgi:opacity protein-like surface antigen